MKTIKTTHKLCLSCMEVHDVKEVKVADEVMFKNECVKFNAIYEYCALTEEYTQTEEMIRINDLAMKDAYRKKKNLLTSSAIIAIREKYGVSQKDFSEILGWGRATITRYENHQVQDVAHDDILRKVDSDPNWFLTLLNRAKDKLNEKVFVKYSKQAKKLYSLKKNSYLIDSINAIYAELQEDDLLTGSSKLNLKKVEEEINYLAQNVQSLYKVKLMKMLWYSDVLNYRRKGFSITGLAYRALPMGAVPEGYDQIVLLDKVCYDEILYEDNTAYKFKPFKEFKPVELTDEDIITINDVIKEFGDMNTGEIVRTMHEEDAYKYTDSNCLISYKFAETLSIE
ncbi:type II TA system antitoxin MqsA family protein [Clostridium tyrobutyricum]|jgi:putative zinc finger/helix-turn-helix YgiT family protein|uniref:type II TA system antitoxin MqsA family protein n=1 Tax=Clostridium tyrobutyricum TaxID=1519 RepID=UPI00189E26A3|nr:type II TA system antitoxin MqsA family protein [Clostridium tyrobutyricum]